MGLADYRGSDIGIWCMRDKVKAAEIAKYYFPPQFEANKSNYDSPKLMLKQWKLNYLQYWKYLWYVLAVSWQVVRKPLWRQ